MMNTMLHRLLRLMRSVPLFAAVCLLGLPVAGQAATATANLTVTATVLSACTITAAPVVFGNYGGGVTDATGAVTATCTSGTTYTLSLNAGSGSGATVAARLMTSGGQTLTYSLYSDSGHTSVWGATIGTNTVAGTGSGLPQAITVYGRIPASQLSPAGAYTDTVTATITY